MLERALHSVRAPERQVSVNTTTGARRITNEGAKRTRAAVSQPRSQVEPVLGPAFVSVCGAVLLAALLMSMILAMGSARPVPSYALFGSGLFGAVFAAFLVGALHLALTDSRRSTDDH